MGMGKRYSRRNSCGTQFNKITKDQGKPGP